MYKILCFFFVAEKISDTKLQNMDNASLIKYLFPIKDAGQWIVNMILKFALGREDMFSLDNLGIKQNMPKLYLLDTADKNVLKFKTMKIFAK